MGGEILASKIAEGKHYTELTHRLEPDGCLPATYKRQCSLEVTQG